MPKLTSFTYQAKVRWWWRFGQSFNSSLIIVFCKQASFMFGKNAFCQDEKQQCMCQFIFEREGGRRSCSLSSSECEDDWEAAKKWLLLLSFFLFFQHQCIQECFFSLRNNQNQFEGTPEEHQPQRMSMMEAEDASFFAFSGKTFFFHRSRWLLLFCCQWKQKTDRRRRTLHWTGD